MCHTKVVPRPQNRCTPPKARAERSLPMKNQTFGIEIETTGR